ncbi:hypothetical protein BGZ96_010250 [Linnemannia gamsii]|uniref:Amino acid permease/ SLC12A domain-containing protein n=1 Tax=Linnemannia gamsii TaxID=64522 RepID=A0ABQ7KDS3_9FUNG|nr:hypothetical protein BGZ96_010250 [Linnemannia gamsii]
MDFFIVTSLDEMAAYLPLPGDFVTFGERFVDPVLGFGYTFQWIISVTTEVTSAGKVDPSVLVARPLHVDPGSDLYNPLGWHLLGVSVFGELEY